MTSTKTGALPTEAGGRSLDLDAESFRSTFPGKPFLVRHHLADHPLFEISRLLDLARALPESCVEYNEGNIPVNMSYQSSPRTGLTADETIRRIREAHSWMVLKNVENDAAYGALLDQCLDQVGTLSESIVPGMCHREGFIFLSSPNATTPFHVDPEHNFLLQIRGRKQVCIFDATDTAVATEADIERGLYGKVRNLAYSEQMQSRGQLFELTPGLGVHFPVAAPHWVKNGDDVSVSFSITFRSNRSEKHAAVRQFNARLRKGGVHPKAPGLSPGGDEFKYQLSRVLYRMQRVFRRPA